MKRTGFARPTPGSSPAKARQVRCKVCRQPFEPARPGQLVHVECAAAWAVSLREKVERAAAAQDRRETRAKLAGMLSIAQLIAKAQTAFNAFIRARDADQACICCGKPFERDRPGGSVDAGHYLARGGNTHLRFNEDNCFAQRKNCNRPGGATRADFQAGVLKRIGRERLEAVENSYEVHKWTREELVDIEKKYRLKLRELLKSR